MQLLASWTATLVDKALSSSAGLVAGDSATGSGMLSRELALASLLPNLRNIEHIVLAVHHTLVKSILPSHIAATAEASG